MSEDFVRDGGEDENRKAAMSDTSRGEPHSGPERDSEFPEFDAAREPLYVISIAAKLAGLPLWTLRVLDKEGIVRPQRTASDRRLYSDHDIAALARVRHLTEERGVNMSGVKVILEMERAAPAADARNTDPPDSAEPPVSVEPFAPKERIS